VSGHRAGVGYALGAYVCWGFLPLYFKAIANVPALEIVVYRVLFAALFLALVLSYRRQFSWLKQVWADPRLIMRFSLSALLIGGNWLLYIYAINSGQIVESSLGYFINPLVAVALGALVLGERLATPLWIAVLFALAGVAWLTWLVGRVPWIALGLALSFACYGLMRKTAKLGSLEGLTLETILLFVPALALLGYLAAKGVSVSVHADLALWLWLLLAGPATAIPLLLFAAGARLLPLSTLGFLQYLSPSLQLFLGAVIFQEPFDQQRLIGFALIWLGLLILTAHLLLQAKRSSDAARAGAA